MVAVNDGGDLGDAAAAVLYWSKLKSYQKSDNICLAEHRQITQHAAQTGGTNWYEIINSISTRINKYILYLYTSRRTFV